MFNTRPDDYTFEFVICIIVLLALIGIGAIGWILFSWIF